jgi:uncharacterized protein DUF4399
MMSGAFHRTGEESMRAALAIATPVIALALAASAVVAQERTSSPAGAEVYIISPKDGATVKSPVTVVFGLKGMGVAPAGMKFENSGHHHLLIDTDLPADMGVPLPTTDHVKHFGKGQTESSVELAPGKHTLQLVLGDQNHTPHNPPVVSKKITINVK